MPLGALMSVSCECCQVESLHGADCSSGGVLLSGVFKRA